MTREILELKLRVENSFTGPFWHTEETAIASSNNLTKLRGRYYTTIKGKSKDKHNLEECWAVTNRYSRRYSND